jgi:hypothetical protein
MVRRGIGRYRRFVNPAPWPIARLTILLSLAVLAGPGGASAQAPCGTGRLLLEEVRALPLPATDGVDGWVAGPQGRLALRAAEGKLLELDRDGAATVFALPDTLRAAGLAYIEGALHLIDAAGRVVRADAAPVATGRRFRLTSDEWLESAVRAGSRWYALVLHRDGRRSLRDEGGRELLALPLADLAGRPRRFHLAAAGSQLLVGELVAPFTLLRVDPAAGRVDTLPPPLSAPAARGLAPDSLVAWRALPAVALDCGLLLTLADLTGDRRLLVRYDAQGQVVRVHPLDAPLGLMTRLPDQPVLLGARRAGQLELVWYAWRWVRDPRESP